MNSFNAFLGKEWMGIKRTKKLFITIIVFLLFGIMNPAMAKLTPEIFKMMSAELEEQGMKIDIVTVDALTSWQQYYKNFGMALVVFVLIFAAILVSEYQKDSLILVLTKGMSKTKVYVAKNLMLVFMWTISYAIMTVVTYAYTCYFWDNSIAKHLPFCLFLSWLYGIWICELIMMFSGFMKNFSGVLISLGVVVVGLDMISMIPKTADYLPTALVDLYSILAGQAEPLYTGNIIVTIVTAVGAFVVGLICFNKRENVSA